MVPQHSKISSRQDVNIGTTIGKLQLNLPILSSNMDTVTEDAMAMEMAAQGGAGVLHRFASFEDQCSWLQNMRSSQVRPRIISVGLDVSVKSLGELGIMLGEYDVDAICVDVAHGDHSRALDAITQIRRSTNVEIIAGNVVTGVAACRLVEAGATAVKVGVGPGSVCTTRIVSGHGYPQFSAILDVEARLRLHGYRDTDRHHASIIADGGIRYSGDIVKALAAGADAVMLGSLLAGTEETPGSRVMENGTSYKMFRGMASREVQTEKRPGRTPRVEGVAARVPYRGLVRDTLRDLEAGIRSGLSYSGARNLTELRDSAEFVVVTNNTLRESHPRHTF
tara:strand:- start:70245 stop:71255 length:1011 start_codon:yes stop_codon:yes gene_type:complete